MVIIGAIISFRESGVAKLKGIICKIFSFVSGIRELSFPINSLKGLSNFDTQNLMSGRISGKGFTTNKEFIFLIGTKFIEKPSLDLFLVGALGLALAVTLRLALGADLVLGATLDLVLGATLDLALDGPSEA